MSATQQLLRFGVFELNLDSEELRKAGTVVKLPPQPLRLLALLASQAGQVVSREQIEKQLWPHETETDSEHVVNKCIKQIRNVLGDSADRPLYVETLPRQGYRFVAPVVSKVVPAPRPQVVESESGERDRPTVRLAASGGVAAALAEAAAPSHAPAPEVMTTPIPAPVPKRQPGFQRWLLIGLGAVVIVGAATGGVIYRRAHRRPVLTEGDTIVLADFENKTGDSILDDETLRQGLSSALEQSPFLNILSDRRIAQTMALMTQPKAALLTPELASEICVRTGSRATIEGTIALLGKDYVVGLKTVDCHTGKDIALEQFTVDQKEEILPALGKAASRIRRKLGESPASVQKYDVPLEDVTTPSLEALQAYSLGRRAFSRGDQTSLAFLKKAVEIDPNFAMGYVGLSMHYQGTQQEAELARRAYELRDKVSERERLSIEAIYYLDVTEELDKAAMVYELLRQSYPRDIVSYTNLSYTYEELGEWENALEQAREALRLEPNHIAYGNASLAYTSLNRLDEAEAVLKQAKEHNILLFTRWYFLAFLRGDTAEMSRCVTAAGTDLLEWQADTEAWYGKLKNANELSRRALDSIQHNQGKEAAANYLARTAVRDVEFGNPQRGRAEVEAAIKLAPNVEQPWAILALARAGETARAEKLTADLDKAHPLGTTVQQYWLPTIRAAVALHRKEPKRAIELLKTANAIELTDEGGLHPAYLRGEAYLMLQDGNAAAAEFQKFIDHRGVTGTLPLGALSRLGLARAYSMQGDTTRARAAYENFLTLWKDADPDISIYRQAKAEYARLQ